MLGAQLKLVGSCRNEADERLVQSLKSERAGQGGAWRSGAWLVGEAMWGEGMGKP